MKKFLSLLLALCLVLGLCAVPALADDVPVVSFMYSGSGTTVDENCLVAQEVEARIGVHLNPIFVAPGDFDAKLNSLIAARDLPDLFNIGLTDALQFIDEGMLLALDDLLPEYGQNILANVSELLPQAPANKVDGSTYMIVRNSSGYTCDYAVRVDWLKNLGLEMPTDLDSLYDVLYAFTFNDPDQNGADDTIGLVLTMTQNMQWEPIFGAFGIAYNSNALLEDGTVTTYMKHPHYLDAINYLRKLYQAGVMDPEFATMPAMTAHESLWSGRCGTYGFQFVGTANNWFPGRYTFVDPENPGDVRDLFGYTFIEGPYGDKGTPKRYPGLGSGFVIASTSKNPEAALKFLDYQFTEEGDELLYLGVEGVMYEWTDKENGKYQRLGVYVDDAAHRAAGGFGFWNSCIVNNTELKTMNALTQEAQAASREVAFDWPHFEAALEASAEYGTTLSEITAEALAQLIVTTGDVEAEYAEFVSRWENEGGLEWEAEATAAYNAEHE